MEGRIKEEEEEGEEGEEKERGEKGRKRRNRGERSNHCISCKNGQTTVTVQETEAHCQAATYSYVPPPSFSSLLDTNNQNSG